MNSNASNVEVLFPLTHTINMIVWLRCGLQIIKQFRTYIPLGEFFYSYITLHQSQCPKHSIAFGNAMKDRSQGFMKVKCELKEEKKFNVIIFISTFVKLEREKLE